MRGNTGQVALWQSHLRAGNVGALWNLLPGLGWVCPCLSRCAVIGKHKDKLTREIIEACEVGDPGSECVGAPSLSLSERECYLLGDEEDLSHSPLVTGRLVTG